MPRTLLSLALILSADLAPAADLHFCWIGGGGYAMSGRMQVPDAVMSRDLVTEDDVIAFEISGYHNETFLGSWDMRQRDDDTTWHLRFDPAAMLFLTGGSFATTFSQGWNADGNVMNCGNPGFGFNSGNYAQDICVNGAYITESSIDPATPFPVQVGSGVPDCRPSVLSSKSRIKY